MPASKPWPAMWQSAPSFASWMHSWSSNFHPLTSIWSISALVSVICEPGIGLFTPEYITLHSIAFCRMYIRRQGLRDDTHQQRISEYSATKRAEVRFVRISFLEEM